MAYTAPSTINEYSEAAPLINVHAMSGYQVPQGSYQIQEAKTYSYEGSCCGCYRDNEDAVISPSAISISRRYGCGCCVYQDSTVVNLKLVESARVNHPISGCGLFWAWFLFGCFGWHRFCAGRYKTGFLLFALFTLSLTLTPMGYIFADEYNWSGAGWMFITAIVSSVVLAMLVIFWFVDAFFLRGWAQCVSLLAFCSTFNPSGTLRFPGSKLASCLSHRA